MNSIAKLRQMFVDLLTLPRRVDHLQREVGRLTEILNDAWRDNWGFTPTTEAETRHLANAMRPIIDPRLVWFAEIDGEPAGRARFGSGASVNRLLPDNVLLAP